MRGLAIVVLVAAGAAPAAAQDSLTLSERVERLERQAQGGGGGTVADLVLKVNELQQEVRELRGQVEQQQHELEGLRARQRDQYLDLDRRLEAAGAGERRPDPGAAAAGETPDPDVRPAPSDPGALPDVRGEPAAERGEPARPVADDADRQRAYEQAFALLRNGKYAEAAEAFREFLEQYPDGPLADNAQYWLGESYYVTGNYDIALNAFQAVLNRFPDSQKLPDAHLKLGFSYYELEQWDQARETLKEVAQAYPDSAVARLAQDRLRSMRIEGQ